MKISINFSDGTSYNPSEPTKRKVAHFVRSRKENMGVFKGSCTVTYMRGYYNSFDFSSVDDLEYKLMPCIETDLVKEFTWKN